MPATRATMSGARVRPVLVESNVILDVATADEAWSTWLEAMMRRLADEPP